MCYNYNTDKNVDYNGQRGRLTSYDAKAGTWTLWLYKQETLVSLK